MVVGGNNHFKCHASDACYINEDIRTGNDYVYVPVYAVVTLQQNDRRIASIIPGILFLFEKIEGGG